MGQGQRPVAADVVQERAREQLRQAVAAVLATATSGATFQQALTARSITWEVQQDAAGQSSMSFTQSGHTFAGTELSPAFSVEGMAAQMKANRQAQQPAAPEQRPVAAPLPAPEPPAFRLADVPTAKLALFGLSAARLQESGQLQKLLNGELTDLLTMQGGAQSGKAPVVFEGRLLLTREENGEVDLKISLPRLPGVAPTLAAAPAQRPVATPTPAPELRPPPPAPAVKPAPPAPDPPKRKGPRLR